MEAYFKGSTNTLVLTGVKSTRNGTPLNNAVGIAELLDSKGVLLYGPVSLVYTPASAGEYTAEFPGSISVPAVGKLVDVRITFNAGSQNYRGILHAQVSEAV